MIYLIVGCAFASGAIIGWVARGGYENFIADMDRQMDSGL